MAEFTETVTTTKSVNCPTCASERVVKSGKQSGEQRYLCRGCNRRFRANGMAPKRRIPAEWIGAAIRQYYSGMSYKQIAEYMKDAHDIPEPSKATVYEWVRDYTQAALAEMENHPVRTGGHWVVDEMVLDVGGDKYWNWNVMDSETRYLLASHLSSERDQNAAETVLRKAAKASAEPPSRITTDKLQSYVPAIRKVFPDAQHIQSEGLDSELNNNRSERVQGTFRDRTKTLRGLDSRASGQRYLDGWVLHYNLFREHESLGHKPPAQAARLDAPFSEWADVTRGTAKPPSETESQEVKAQTTVGQWVRENREAVNAYRTEHPELAWQVIPVSQVMGNSEKQKVRQSRPAPGFHQGSRYYVMRMPDGQLAYVRVSAQWGDLPAVEPTGKRLGMGERNWTLEGGKKTRSGQPAKVSQAGYIPIGEDGKPRATEGTATPKVRERIPDDVDVESVTVKAKPGNGGQRTYTPKSRTLSGHAPRWVEPIIPTGPGTQGKIRRHQRAARLHQNPSRPRESGKTRVNISFGR